eukprot:TRINITY_DN12131_c0_g1_i1.p3 TRINITY_DN12131_c0_g1~~TRINITY_DN12131_c0_g1_i1.p3  ORF type:complete len:106 (+),score=8.35 TRINITY_DN12131_c0_g1_i1:93-410(+)
MCIRDRAVASHLMREILVDYARTRNRDKRGGGLAPVSIEAVGELAVAPDVELTALDEALDRLEGIDPQQGLSLIHISEPTRLGMISYAVFCLKKKTQHLCQTSTH